MELAPVTYLSNQIMGRLFTEIDTKIKMLKGVRTQSESLRRELNLLVARSIDELTNSGDAPRTAIAREHGEQMREWMHDMEDCIERFLHRITCQKEAGRLRGAVHAVKTLGIRNQFAKEMKQLKQRLQELGGGQSPATAGTKPAARPRHLPMEERPVGIARAKEDLLMLLDEAEGEAAQKLRVISIVGFGGSGKTTLANAVYKSPAAADAQRFPLRAWVHRCHYEDESGLLKKIIKEFWGRAGEADTQESDQWRLQEYLQRNLGKQRYLIVLVDVDMRHWRWVELTFQDNGTSSRIIVTTSMLSTAKQCSSYGDGYVYQMRNLGKKCSEKIALGSQLTAGDHPASRTALLEKCDGHPLALVSVASHISGRINNSPTRHHCTELCNRLGSFLHAVPSEGVDHFADLRGVLINNYTSLSYCTVQPSLLYLGIFPNDGCSLKRNKITRRWVAEGYARSKDPRRSEQEVADANFMGFVDRNIIQPVGVSSRTCKALGVVHEFVVHKSISDNFIMPFNAPELRTDLALRHEEKVRHLFVNDSNVTSCGTTLNMDLSRVRSLTVFSESAGGVFSKFTKFRLMRVLDLEKCSEVNEHHLRRICKLWNLRYLSLGDNIKKLPKAIAHLKLLETLVVSKMEVTELPVEVLGLPCLIHLVGKFTLPKKLPKKEKLEKLCQENKLQTLAGFIANGNQGFLQLMVHNKNLRKVKIWCDSTGEVRDINNLNDDLVKAIQEYSKAPLTPHGQVRSLSIDFQIFPEGPLPEGTIYHLSSLKLQGNLSTMPRFVSFLPVEELTRLCISLTVLTRELLSAISGLRYLVHLKLIVDKVTEGLVIEIGEFIKLQRLYFVVTRPNTVIPRMQVQHGYLPELVSLQLLSEHLTGTSGIEIRHLTKLQEIELHPDVSEPARQEWEAAARNHPNRPNVLPFKCIDDPDASVAPVGEEAIGNPVAGAAWEELAPAHENVFEEQPADDGPDPVTAQNMLHLNSHQPTKENPVCPEEAAPQSAIPGKPIEEASNKSPVQMDQQATSTFTMSVPSAGSSRSSIELLNASNGSIRKW